MNFLETVLETFHGWFEPVAGVNAWGWAIVLLTLLVRAALIPLAVKQMEAMRNVQKIQPKVKELQKKYKVTKDLLRDNPEKYRRQKERLQQATLQVYKDHNLNPLASFIPLIAQAPIFFLLFYTVRGMDKLGDFYLFTAGAESGLVSLAWVSGPRAWLLCLLVGIPLFISQRLTAKFSMTAANDKQHEMQRKFLMFVVPLALIGVSFAMPLGVVLYLVTSNVWQAVQQYVLTRKAET